MRQNCFSHSSRVAASNVLRGLAGAAQAQTAVDTVIIKDAAEQQAAIAEAQKGIDKALIGAAKVGHTFPA